MAVRESQIFAQRGRVVAGLRMADFDDAQRSDEDECCDNQNSRKSGNRLKSYCSSAGMTQKDLRDAITSLQRDNR